MFILFSIILIFCAKGQDFNPQNYSYLNRTQIEFFWPPVPRADYCKFELFNSSDMKIFTDSLEINSSIPDFFFEWGQEYSWIICGEKNDENIFCYDTLNFSIIEKPG